MDRRQLAAYLLTVARQASQRADRVETATDWKQVRAIQAQHERQLAALAGMLSAAAGSGLEPWEYDPEATRPGFLARLRWLLFG